MIKAQYLIWGLLLPQLAVAQAPVENLAVRIDFGHTAREQQARTVIFKAGSPGLQIQNITASGIEQNDRAGQQALLHAGNGDVDGLTVNISWPRPSTPLRKLAGHRDRYSVKDDAMWGFLMENGTRGQGERLRNDPWNKPDGPLLVVQLDAEGTQGFAISLEQLVRHRAMWLPEHDVFITLAGKPLSFRKHLASLKGKRVLDEVAAQPEASLEKFKEAWEDFGNPLEWKASWQTEWMGTKGHLTVMAPAHGAIYKFAVDRGGNVRPDFASPHKFRLDLQWDESQWKKQRILNGLPVIVTDLEKDGQQAEITQFVSPLADPSTVVRGYLPGVMLTQVKLSGKSGPVRFGLSLAGPAADTQLHVSTVSGNWVVADKRSGNILLLLQAGQGFSVTAEHGAKATLTVTGHLKEGQPLAFVVKLPSPAVKETGRLSALEFEAAKQQTVTYWERWLAGGAQFEVPEQAVNDLFRANLWHSLVLPRHTIGTDNAPHMDLPYANTAYGQKDADWPINQAVYVDYMIYGLRGYDSVAQQELLAMFKSQQQKDGRIGGFANWGVYSPAQLYAIAQNYLLSANREYFEELLPASLKTLDWCLAQVEAANAAGNTSGLIRAPLNDLTNAEREWAFTQAYYVAGLEIFAKALKAYNHPRAEAVAITAAKMKADVVKEFSRASVLSPVVQVADGTWVNYVPTDAMTPRRLMDQWYPTDVDCGPLHLSRLGVIAPDSWLTTAMLHDHEDNLFFRNLGAANEPVYVQQSAVYLQRDEQKAAIRSFYSLMACGFSHEQLTSLEHRWAWGQYYGPPSTDGAWFELYRNMLVRETGMDTLLIGQAIPRAWLEDGKKIAVKQAPTYFGPLTMTMESHVAQKEIVTTLELSERNPPRMLVVRLRHPQGSAIRSVTVNGQNWKNFDTKKELVVIPAPEGKRYTISARY